MSPANALQAASESGLTAQRLVRLAPEYRSLLMEGIKQLWDAETSVTQTYDDLTSIKSRLQDAKAAYTWALRRRDRIRRDLSALLPELEAIQAAEETTP